VPDGSIFGPGEEFTKTWRLRNDGTCTWTTDYRVVFVDGESMNIHNSVAIPEVVIPGETVNVSVPMRAPTNPGIYRSNFELRNEAGVQFGLGKKKDEPFWLEVSVQESITTLDFVEETCSAQWLSGAGALPCPGRDGDSRGFVLKLDNPKLENGKSYENPGLLTSPQGISDGYIMGIFPTYRVQKGDRFQSIVNCEAGATDCFVVFRLDYQIGSGTIQTYWAFVEQHEGISYQADIDLDRLVGQDVKFILSVLAVGSADGDRAVWGAPRIIHKFEPDTPAAIFTPTQTASPTVTLTPTTTNTSPVVDRSNPNYFYYYFYPYYPYYPYYP
jgi:hypothetical protein